MLKQRILTAIVLLAGLFVLFRFFSIFWVNAFFVLVVALAAREWAKLSGVVQPFMQWLFAGISALMVLAVQDIVSDKLLVTMLALLSFFWIVAVVYLLFMVKKIHSRNRISVPKLLLGCVILTGAFLAIVLLLERFDHDRKLLLFLVAIVWITDTGAYFVGKAIGKNKFSPVISPGKTWQGVAGGVLTAMLYGYFIAPWFVVEEQRLLFTALVLLASWVSVFGDLLESLLKRQAGYKDSGHILPGHGGILDRIDSLLAFLPVMATGVYYVS